MDMGEGESGTNRESSTDMYMLSQFSRSVVSDSL